MNRILAGFAAGLAATVVLSILMILKSAAGMLPQMNAIGMLTQMGQNYLALPANPAVGWVAHAIIGVIAWGGLFALLADKLPGPMWARGMLFSVGAWLLMMIVVMPMAGAGFFAAGIGPAAAIATLVLHLIFGAVLGGVFDRLTETTGYGRHSTQTNEGRA